MGNSAYSSASRTLRYLVGFAAFYYLFTLAE